MARRRRPQRNLALLERLTDARVEFCIIGGVAAVLHGATRMTTIELEVGSRRCKVIAIDDLIAIKRSLTRPQDIEVALQLEAVRAGRFEDE